MVRTPQQDLQRELRDPEFAKLYGAEKAKSEFAIELALKNKAVYQCLRCGIAMVVPQRSRIKYCPACRHLREVEGGKNR